jgi:hypothetical protein
MVNRVDKKCDLNKKAEAKMMRFGINYVLQNIKV